MKDKKKLVLLNRWYRRSDMGGIESERGKCL